MTPKPRAPTPNKRSRRPVGLLGVAQAGSSDDDEDYSPSGGGGGGARRQRRRASEEDVPLAQLLRQRQARASAAAQTAPAAAAGPAIHLPIEVLSHILRLACAPAAGGAIPTAAAGGPLGDEP